jgi:glycosyltransferase involved in cell wall biosynthesis
MLPITVIVPVRNAETMVEDCLAAIVRANPAEIIVVDGNSTDRTLEMVRRFPVSILSDEGRGVPAARMLGIRAATYPVVALVDADIILGEGALQELFDEFTAQGYDGLQAGLVSISGKGYWGQALVYHHNHGRSKHWPGVMATLFHRSVLLEYPFDEHFRSGEDIELRWRLQKAGLKLGVSKKTVVHHRFGDTYEVAKDQWRQDGRGLARMVVKYGWPAAGLLAIPAAGCVRGVLLSLVRLQPRWIPYYLAYLVYNYLAMPAGLRERLA